MTHAEEFVAFTKNCTKKVFSTPQNDKFCGKHCWKKRQNCGFVCLCVCLFYEKVDKITIRY